jgi:steroid 5-alpha reductase family enzyme
MPPQAIQFSIRSTMSKPATKSWIAIFVALAIAALVAWATGYRGERVAWRWVQGGVPLVVVCAAVAFLVQWVVYLPSYLARTEKFYDLAGSATFLLLLALAAKGASKLDVADKVLLAMCAVWALRLGSFLAWRVHQAGFDRRFEQIKQDPVRFLVTWTLQGLWVFVTLSPVLAVVAQPGVHKTTAWTYAGFAIWCLGFGIEVLADWQKSRFRANPANGGRFITSGLWAWSRHPNYVGEIVLWLGVFVACMPVLQGWAWVSVVSPLLVVLLLTRVSGIPMLEASAQKRWGADPAWQAYVARTPVLWPGWPPRRTDAPKA